jgi:hypothetical protein
MVLTTSQVAALGAAVAHIKTGEQVIVRVDAANVIVVNAVETEETLVAAPGGQALHPASVKRVVQPNWFMEASKTLAADYERIKREFIERRNRDAPDGR